MPTSEELAYGQNISGALFWRLRSKLTDLLSRGPKSGDLWEVAKNWNRRSLVDCRRNCQFCSHYIQCLKLTRWKAGRTEWIASRRKILAALPMNPMRMLLVDQLASHMCPTVQTDWLMAPTKMGPLNQLSLRMMVLIVRPALPSMMLPSSNLLGMLDLSLEHG
jgi:hypothetical protein